MASLNIPQKKKEEDKDNRSSFPSGIYPRTRVTVRPDRRAQAVLRRAEAPKVVTKTGYGKVTTIRQNGVGVNISKLTTPRWSGKGTESELGFYRTSQTRPAYATKSGQRAIKRANGWSGDTVRTAQGMHKERLRRAAIEHGLGRQMSDVRPGHDVTASTVRSPRGRDPRARIYSRMTNGALSFEGGKEKSTRATKETKTTWSNDLGDIVKFNPNDLRNRLKAMAQSNVVRAGLRIIGGPQMNGALMADDAITAATGKRPSKEISKAHTKQQSETIKEDLKNKRRRAPWAGSGPF